MNFKGTEKRTARDLAEVLECRGGQLNAYTTKEYTNFYCQTVSEDYELAMDVLSDLFLHSVYDPDELEKEKKIKWPGKSFGSKRNIKNRWSLVSMVV